MLYITHMEKMDEVKYISMKKGRNRVTRVTYGSGRDEFLTLNLHQKTVMLMRQCSVANSRNHRIWYGGWDFLLEEKDETRLGLAWFSPETKRREKREPTFPIPIS